MPSYFGALFKSSASAERALILLVRKTGKGLAVPNSDVPNGRLYILPEACEQDMDGLGIRYRKLTAKEVRRIYPTETTELLETIQRIDGIIDPDYIIGFTM